MSSWNELTLSELPALKLLQKLGYTYVTPKKIEEERDSLTEPVLLNRLKQVIKNLNPWISDPNIQQAITKITRVSGTSDIEINQDIHEKFIKYFSVSQDLGNGSRHHTVKVIDFENPRNNEFVVTQQYRVKGPKREIRCDLVCFVNGLPIVVIEAKNPVMAGGNPEQAIKQLNRYQDRERGAPRLFHTTTLLLAINRVQAFIGTNNTPMQHYLEWKDPFPLTVPEVENIVGRTPQTQDIAIVGALQPENLLDIMRNFIVYEVESGKIIKKIPRYQQYRATNKAIERILEHWKATEEERVEKESAKNRGGVIWHTQGSGKSLTMLFLAVKLRLVEELANPTVVIVTDRIDLDNQITGTFQRCGFPSPIRANSTRHLKELVSNIDQVSGQTILTTIHKFQEKNRAAIFPELAKSPNIIVMTDEGHRTQYKGLAANMRTAMPNATYIAFTGTPLIKRQNITTSTFSSYIDKYSIDQAVEDKATVQIFYESRLADLHVEKQMMDDLLEIELEEYDEDDQQKIKKRYANLRSVLAAESRIQRVAMDLYKHFRENIHKNGFKAQVVAVNRITASRYKKIIDGLIRESHNIECAVVYSSTPNDEGDLLTYQNTKEEEEALIQRFKDPEDRLSIMIVVDKLLTGFDAPVEQVMYLDNVLKDHSLLQAVARVNRTFRGKTFGLIVDYVGISKYLQRALEIFDQDDMTNVLIPFSEAIENLRIARQEAMAYFEDVPKKGNIDQFYEAISTDDETINAFINKCKNFERTLDMVLPDPMANDFKEDYVFTIKLQEYLRNLGKGGLGKDFRAISQKIKDLIDEHVRAQGIQIIIPPISILSPEFDSHIELFAGSSKARALMMEHALKMEISERRGENPEFYDSLSERLEKIIEQYKLQRLNDAEFIHEINPIILEIQTIRKTASNLGMTETEFAFYKLLNAHLEYKEKEVNEPVKLLTEEILTDLGTLTVVDWKFKDDIQRKMRSQIKLQLREVESDFNKREALSIQFIELAKNHL